jgi:hypothetical protein
LWTGAGRKPLLDWPAKEKKLLPGPERGPIQDGQTLVHSKTCPERNGIARESGIKDNGNHGCSNKKDPVSCTGKKSPCPRQLKSQEAMDTDKTLRY